MKLIKSNSLNNFFHYYKNNSNIINNNNKIKNCCKIQTINDYSYFNNYKEKYKIKYNKNISYLRLYKKINNKINNILNTNKIFNSFNISDDNILNLRKTLPKSLSSTFDDNKVNLLLNNNNKNLNNCFNIKNLKIFNLDNVKINNNNKNNKNFDNINKIITNEKCYEDYRKKYKSQENKNINKNSNLFAKNFLNLIKTNTFYCNQIYKKNMKVYKNINLPLLNKKIILVNLIKNIKNNID